MKVSANGHYLIDGSGKPFFYLADTAWMLFYEPDREEVAEYLKNRKAKGFTVIMSTCVMERFADEGNANRYGFEPFIGDDPDKPCEEFFANVDYVVETANNMGLYVAMLPVWGEFVGPLKWGKGPIIFNEAKAYNYGRFIGKRYGKRDVFWVLGGDRNPEEEQYLRVWRALAAGLKEADGGKNLMTYHPTPDNENDLLSSGDWLHDEPWLDFNMIQTGTRWDRGNFKHVRKDYLRMPAKPTLDGEARYENSHEIFWTTPKMGRRITAHQVRKAAYNAMMSGAMGHTYGCRDTWSFSVPIPGKRKMRDVSLFWKEAMDLPGAYQMGLLKKLFTDYPWYRLIPDIDNKLIPYACMDDTTYTPAAIAEDKSFALVYVPESVPVYINPNVLYEDNPNTAGTGNPDTVGSDDVKLHGTSDAKMLYRIRAEWYNPRTGQYFYAKYREENDYLEFIPPTDDKDPDYVLVLNPVK